MIFLVLFQEKMIQRIKYYPLLYTIFTRITSFSDIVYYFWTYLLPPIIWIIYLWIQFNDVNLAVSYSLLYIYIYLLFEVFYEIWYIFNDVFVAKKEKRGTKRVDANLSKSFWIFQIILRILIWLILLYILWIPNEMINYLVMDIVFMGIIFSIHNKIRNYSINIYTWIFLRISKIYLFVFVLNVIPLNFSDYNMIELAILFFYIVDFLWLWIYQYNKCLWWTNELKYGYTYFFYLIVFIALSLTFKSTEFLLPLILIIPKVIFFLFSNPWSFSLKNER